TEVVDVAVAHHHLRAPAQVEPRRGCAGMQRGDALGRADPAVEDEDSAAAVLDGIGVHRPARIGERDGHLQTVNAQGAADRVAVGSGGLGGHYDFEAWIAARSSGSTLNRSATIP